MLQYIQEANPRWLQKKMLVHAKVVLTSQPQCKSGVADRETLALLEKGDRKKIDRLACCS